MENMDTNLLQEIHEMLNQHPIKYIVLDDDPTGTQCSNHVYVYTKWGEEEIHRLFEDGQPASFILTNSRAMRKEETVALHQEIIQTICKVAKELHREFQILSRSDSTLRWNYPCEVDAIQQTLQKNGISVGAQIICPYFFEGGRITHDNIHYVKMDGKEIPAAETEFAKDRTFGFAHSDLRDYVREKYHSKIADDRFICITEESLQQQSKVVFEQLRNTKEDSFVIVNATNDTELAWFALAYLKACVAGEHLIYRGASSFMRFLMNVPYTDLWSQDSQNKKPNGGLIVAGSHVNKTTRQLAFAEEQGLFETVVFHQELLLEADSKVEAECSRCIREVEQLLSSGKNVCFMTDRKRVDVPGGTEAQQLTLATRIAEVFLSTACSIQTIPSFVIAKGGITSCEYGKKLLRDSRVLVVGQIEPGIPVWLLGEHAVYPNSPYVVFPGNVGSDSTVADVIKRMKF